MRDLPPLFDPKSGEESNLIYTHPAPVIVQRACQPHRGFPEEGRIFNMIIITTLHLYDHIFISCEWLSCLGAVAHRAEELGAGWVFRSPISDRSTNIDDLLRLLGTESAGGPAGGTPYPLPGEGGEGRVVGYPLGDPPDPLGTPKNRLFRTPRGVQK